MYVGARVCGGCHSAASMGASTVNGSFPSRARHSRARRAGRDPNIEVARAADAAAGPGDLAGMPRQAWSAEGWEKDATLPIQDGVQCELCHGPGSEYASIDVMEDRGAAMMAGLRMPDQDLCINCRIEKGSHLAVMKQPPLDVKKGWPLLLHPLPPNPRPGPMSGQAPVDVKAKGPKYAGVMMCGKCHHGPALGNQWSVWRMSAHAGAWAVLGTQKAKRSLPAWASPTQSSAHA